jgi:hypothetical protein
MATERQLKRLYWPGWAAAVRANWRREKGRVVVAPGAAANPWRDQVELAAEGMGASALAVVDWDWLRHAAHWVALGRDVSSKALNNGQLDRVLVLFRLLANPLDLQAVLDWQAPGRPDRRRTEWAMRHLPHTDGYVRSVCSAKFGTRRWESLEDRALHQLLMTLKNRPASRRGAETRESRDAGPMNANLEATHEPF